MSALKNLMPGAEVLLRMNGADTAWIVVQQGSPDPNLYQNAGGTWLLLKSPAENCIPAPMPQSGVDAYYPYLDELQSRLDRMAQALEEGLRPRVRRPLIPICTARNTVVGWEAELFVPSLRELGETGGPADGAPLAWFRGLDRDTLRSRRRCPETAASRTYWTRTSGGGLSFITRDGSANEALWSVIGYHAEGVRPLLILPGWLELDAAGRVMPGQEIRVRTADGWHRARKLLARDADGWHPARRAV